VITFYISSIREVFHYETTSKRVLIISARGSSELLIIVPVQRIGCVLTTYVLCFNCKGKYNNRDLSRGNNCLQNSVTSDVTI